MMITTYKEFLNESKKTKSKFKFIDLPEDTKSEIVQQIFNNIPIVKDTWWSASEFRDECEEFLNKFIFKITPKNVSWLSHKYITSNEISDANLNKLRSILKEKGELDPIVYNGDEFFDGRHRVLAYSLEGIEMIPSIDIQEVLDEKMWEDYVNGSSMNESKQSYKEYCEQVGVPYYYSDNIRVAHIEQSMKSPIDSTYPDRKRLLDTWDGYDDLTVAKKHDEVQIYYWEGWVTSC